MGLGYSTCANTTSCSYNIYTYTSVIGHHDNYINIGLLVIVYGIILVLTRSFIFTSNMTWSRHDEMTIQYNIFTYLTN